MRLRHSPTNILLPGTENSTRPTAFPIVFGVKMLSYRDGKHIVVWHN